MCLWLLKISYFKSSRWNLCTALMQQETLCSLTIVITCNEWSIRKNFIRETLHKKWSFPLKISSTNETKSAVLHFLCSESLGSADYFQSFPGMVCFCFCFVCLFFVFLFFFLQKYSLEVKKTNPTLQKHPKKPI